MEAKKWYNSNTIRLGAAEVLTGLAGLITSMPAEFSWTFFGVGVATIILRAITKVPITK